MAHVATPSVLKIFAFSPLEVRDEFEEVSPNAVCTILKNSLFLPKAVLKIQK